MKKFAAFSIILIICLFAESLINTKGEPASDIQQLHTRYVFLSPSGSVNYRGMIANGIYKADKEFQSDTELIACTDMEMIQQMITRSIYTKVDGIIISGTQYTESLAASIDQARSQNIPVVLVDQKPEGLNCDGYFGINNYDAGKMAGERFSQSGTSEIHVAVLLNSLKSQNQQERLEGFCDAICGSSNITLSAVIEGEGDYLLLREKVLEILNENSNINAFFCAEATSTVYLQMILESLDKSEIDGKIRIIGFDTAENSLDYLRSGDYEALIVQDTEAMGYEAVKYLEEYRKGETSSNSEQYVSVEIIDQNHINQYEQIQMEDTVWKLY